MDTVSTTLELADQGGIANCPERHPLMSFRPLTLLLAAFWVLVITSFVGLRV
jgi:hypothetical protein